MEKEFINVYIEKMTKKLEDFSKQEILLQTQLELAQRVVNSQQAQINELNGKLEKLEASLNKKASKKETNDF